ncbi:MAG TPA: phosphoribosylglycinamide formyltransferase [Candidatus Kryptobacter bacterium]|nr:phosphoribosylglycinamide formyltransferase [Candidatus Kryptobacter bacterium]
MKVAVFVSGRGTNLLNIIRKSKDGFLRSEVRLVISDRDCEAIENSERAGILTKVADPKSFRDEAEFGDTLLDVLKKAEIDFIVLAGYLKKIPDSVIKNYANRIINIHPALLPSFGGKGMYGMKVHQAVLDYGCKVSGVTVHVVDVEYDHGPVVLQKCVPVSGDDTPETLASKIHQLEYELLPEAIKLFESHQVKIEGRKIVISPEGSHRT